MSSAARACSPLSVTAWSLTQALDRPERSKTRLKKRWSSSTKIPNSLRSVCMRSEAGSSNTATTEALCAPCRMSVKSLRAPSTSPSESSKTDLPAPVSPVKTTNPVPGRRVSDLMRTTSVIWISVSMALLHLHRVYRPAASPGGHPGAFRARKSPRAGGYQLDWL